MKIIKRVLVTILGISIVLSCSKDEGGSSNNVDSNLILYKNQTGDISANALQAQYKDSQGVLNFYGNFDAESNPTLIRTLTYQKTNNDTIVNLIIDPLTSRVNSSYTSVNGVKSDVVIKFDYPNDTHLSVSIHQFDWVNNTSEIIFGANLEIPSSTANKSSNTKKGISLSSSGDGIWKIGSLLTGLVVAEIVGTIGGGFTLGIFSGLGAAAAAAISAPLLATGAALAIAAAIIPSDAFSSEIAPSDLPYPEDTPIENPITTEKDPTPNLTSFDCSGTFISFKPVMYQDGTIVIEDISGGIGPYLYLVETEIRDFQIFPNNYDDGGYEVCLRDANGCITCSYSLLERPINCDNTTLSLTTTTTTNSATANVTGGQAPYTYLWSNDSTSSTASNLTEGTYTVIVTDQAGCTSTASVVISSASSFKDLIIGTWKEVGYTVNGVNEFDSSDCDLIAVVTQTQIFSTEYYGDNPGECDKSDTSTSDYSVSGNTIIWSADGVTEYSEILELNQTTLIIKEVEGASFIYIQTLSRQ